MSTVVDWKRIEDGPPLSVSRVLVVRNVGGQRYVDVVAYFPEPECGLPPLCNMRHVTHWADLPEPPPDEA